MLLEYRIDQPRKRLTRSALITASPPQ